MAILRIKDENGVPREVFALKGEKGDQGGSTDLDALKKIEAIQQELINNGGTVTIDGLPDVTVEDNSKVLQVVNGEWSAEYINGVSAGGDSAGCRLPEATAENEFKIPMSVNGEWKAVDPPEGLPELTSIQNGWVLTSVNGVWEAKPIPYVDVECNVPDALTGKDGDVLQIVGNEWKAVTPTNNGGGQEYFADVSEYEGGGKNLGVEGTLGLNANNVVVNGASFTKEGDYTKIMGVTVPADADPYYAVNKGYVDNTIKTAIDNIPTGGDGSATPVNADWNASEGEDGYVENRTHYDVLKTTLWESKSYSAVTTDSNGAFYRSIHDPTQLADGTHPVFEVGATYEVIFNGNEPIYCEAFPSHVRGTATNYLAIGNPSLTKKPDTYIQEDNGLPFFYVTTMDDGSKAYLYVQNNEAATITINKVVERSFKQLDPKYLPDNVKLPEVDPALDVGKVLAVNDSGAWEKTTLETGGGVPPADYVVEEGNAKAIDAQGGSTLCNTLKYRKWNSGLLEISGQLPYTVLNGGEMGSIYFIGQSYFNVTLQDGSPLFSGTPDICIASSSMVGVFVSTDVMDRATMFADASVMYYSASAKESGSVINASLYMTGRWK